MSQAQSKFLAQKKVDKNSADTKNKKIKDPKHLDIYV
jgi:hypothetical protein